MKRELKPLVRIQNTPKRETNGKCNECPFRLENVFKFKADIFDEIKETNRGRDHRCHIHGDLCIGFLEEKAKIKHTQGGWQ